MEDYLTQVLYWGDVVLNKEIVVQNQLQSVFCNPTPIPSCIKPLCSLPEIGYCKLVAIMRVTTYHFFLGNLSIQNQCLTSHEFNTSTILLEYLNVTVDSIHHSSNHSRILTFWYRQCEHCFHNGGNWLSLNGEVSLFQTLKRWTLDSTGIRI